jgi:hypothetical protein
MRNKITGAWRKMHSENLNNLYSPPNIIQMIKSRGMKRAAHVACMEEEGCIRGFGGKTRRKVTNKMTQI